MGIQSTSIRVSLGSRRLGDRKIWRIVANPAALCPILIRVFGIPPDVFLALRPRSTLWVSRGTIIENVAVDWPGKAPSHADICVGMATTRQVLSFFRHNARENPAATSGAAIGFEFCVVFDYLAIGNGVAIDLFDNIFDNRFLLRSLAAIIPEQILNRFITLFDTILVEVFQTDVEFRHKPVL